MAWLRYQRGDRLRRHGRRAGRWCAAGAELPCAESRATEAITGMSVVDRTSERRSVVVDRTSERRSVVVDRTGMEREAADAESSASVHE
jgi:hypothetical protein